MAKNQISTRISPEGLEIANAYLELGSIPAVCTRLQIDEAKASEYLAKREVKAYVDQVYLDTGYRNRFKLALDDIWNNSGICLGTYEAIICSAVFLHGSPTCTPTTRSKDITHWSLEIWATASFVDAFTAITKRKLPLPGNTELAKKMDPGFTSKRRRTSRSSSPS